MGDAGGLQNQIVAASIDSGKGMGSAQKGAGEDSAMNELFKLNQVWFKMPPSLSLVSKRTITRTQFQQTAYPNPSTQVATCIMNTGEFYVSACTSFLVIQAGIDKNANSAITTNYQDTVHALLGQGGILNIFEEVTFTSASGTEIDRQQNKGLQAAHVQRNMLSQQYYDGPGELQGMPGGSFQGNYDTLGFTGVVPTGAVTPAAMASPWLYPIRGTTYWDPTIYYLNGTNGGTMSSSADYSFSSGSKGSVDIAFNSNTSYNATTNTRPGQALTFLIPMSDILGCFSPYMKALFPAAALAGGRLDIRFKNAVEALIATGSGLVNVSAAQAFLNSLQIYNIYIDWDSYQLNDSVLKRLNEVAAGTEGLSVMFDTWDWANTNVSINTFEAQVSQARSRISRSFCVIRDYAAKSNPYANSLASESAGERNFGYNKNYTLNVSAANANSGPFVLLVNSYQAQLGSLYFPQQPLTTLEEYVMNSYYMFGKAYCDASEINGVTVSEFMGAQGYSQYTSSGNPYNPNWNGTNGAIANSSRGQTLSVPAWIQNWGSATYGFLAERSQLLQLTGLPISNARLLRHRFTLNYSSASGLGRQIDVFTQYTRVMKVFLGGRIVMRE